MPYDPPSAIVLDSNRYRKGNSPIQSSLNFVTTGSVIAASSLSAIELNAKLKYVQRANDQVYLVTN